jgi:murein DD-endopeptidase MepM/ murein hydrolase activator NlpD
MLEESIMRFASIVHGSMHSRTSDPYGSGQFAAPRDHHSRQHKGLDIAADPGEAVLSPIEGDLVREAIPYPPFTGLLIQGVGAHAGYSVKLFYVEGRGCGRVAAGGVIGHVQDLRYVYPGITNHIHMEVRYQGKLVPPTDAYKMCF